MSFDPGALARELAAAYSAGSPIATPLSARDASFDLAAAYAVEAELARFRLAKGHSPVGRKVGFANKAMWRILKLDTLVWAHMYDDTVWNAPDNQAMLSIANRVAPRLEPEIVFGLKAAVPAGLTDPVEILQAVDWIALGFEINDCVFPDWKFQPADFVAAYGFHTALAIGARHHVNADNVAVLAAALPSFTLKLSKGDDVVDEGSGKASLGSPALCLGELASAVVRQGAEPLAAGEIISTGTLTDPQPIAAGDVWRGDVAGIDLPSLTVRIISA